MPKKSDDTLTPARIDELLVYLPLLFEKPGIKFVQKWGGGKQKDGVFQIPYPIYAKDVDEFFHKASQPWWCDFHYNPSAAGKMLEDTDVMTKATLEQVKTMLTFCVRGERFCWGGVWESLLEEGKITALLRRLKVLRGEMFPSA